MPPSASPRSLSCVLLLGALAGCARAKAPSEQVERPAGGPSPAERFCVYTPSASVDPDEAAAGRPVIRPLLAAEPARLSRERFERCEVETRCGHGLDVVSRALNRVPEGAQHVEIETELGSLVCDIPASMTNQAAGACSEAGCEPGAPFRLKGIVHFYATPSRVRVSVASGEQAVASEQFAPVYKSKDPSRADCPAICRASTVVSPPGQ